ncbi:MAG: putative endonuclease 4 [Thermoproteota archaeon]|nr:putative endonuclease 4 [Thermoproteota archaeon]
MKVGFHISIAESIDQAVDVAVAMKCGVFQIFTRNPRGWSFQPLNLKEVTRFRKKIEEHGIKPVFDHMPYLPNLASTREEVYLRSTLSLKAELNRCSELGIPFLVTHLGSHLGAGKIGGLKRLISAINDALNETKSNVTIILENTAGTKNSMGSSFEDIKHVVDGVEDLKRIGVCFDTCHGFAAGYDLRSDEAVAKTIRLFNNILGLEKLKLVHLNDSKGDLGSGIDRHEHIGLGRIGDKGFRSILHSDLVKLPLIMETPVDDRRNDFDNLCKVRELAK